MKGKQINFFILPHEISKLDNYLQANDICICVQPMFDASLRIHTSINQPDNNETWNKKILVHRNDLQHIQTWFVAEQGYYVINELDSPVIECSLGVYNAGTQELQRGRLYYNASTYDEQGKLQPKHEHFLHTAEGLFAWFRKTFKNQKYDGYKDFVVTAQTADWLAANNGHLVEA